MTAPNSALHRARTRSRSFPKRYTFGVRFAPVNRRNVSPTKLRPRSPKRTAFTIAAIVVAIPLIAIAVVICWLAVFFNAGMFYSGDGTYSRSDGSRAATFRVDFPPVDLSTRAKRSFHFARLGPQMTFHAGLRVQSAKRSSAVVRLSLSNEKNEVVFDHTVNLEDPEWERDFVHLRGKVTEYQDEHGTTRFRPAEPVRADDGFGTSFTPRWLGRYTFTVEVVQPDSRGLPSTATPVFEAYTAGP